MSTVLPAATCPRTNTRDVCARSSSYARTLAAPTMPRSPTEASANHCVRPFMTLAVSTLRVSSLLTRDSRAGTSPATLRNEKSLRARRCERAACQRVVPRVAVYDPSAAHWPNDPLRTARRRVAADESASTPPLAPLPAFTGSAPGITATACSDTSGTSDTSASPVAGSLSGSPSRVITTCSRRAPRSDSPDSPRADRNAVNGSRAMTPFIVFVPRSRAFDALRLDDTMPARGETGASAATRCSTSCVMSRRPESVASACTRGARVTMTVLPRGAPLISPAGTIRGR